VATGRSATFLRERLSPIICVFEIRAVFRDNHSDYPVLIPHSGRRFKSQRLCHRVGQQSGVGADEAKLRRVAAQGG